jgi:hypothetical protein
MRSNLGDLTQIEDAHILRSIDGQYWFLYRGRDNLRRYMLRVWWLLAVACGVSIILGRFVPKVVVIAVIPSVKSDAVVCISTSWLPQNTLLRIHFFYNEPREAIQLADSAPLSRLIRTAVPIEIISVSGCTQTVRSVPVQLYPIWFLETYFYQCIYLWLYSPYWSLAAISVS